MIEIEALTKRFGRVAAVRNVTFTVPAGRVTAFLGPNGAGKSTTIRLLLGLDHPTSGRALIDGRRYREHRQPLRVVGAHLDGRAVHPGRSARQHLLALARVNGIGGRRVDEVLELVGLSHVARRRTGGYSLGMGQRLGIASALLGDPGVLVLDEPVNGLDTDGVRWIRGLLRNLADEGRTVLVSSHLLAEVAQSADRVVVIGRGRLLADRALEEFTGEADPAVSVQTPDLALLPDLLARLPGATCTVEDRATARVRLTGAGVAAVGEASLAVGMRLHLLAPEHATLEAAYQRLVGAEVEYAAGPRALEEVN